MFPKWGSYQLIPISTHFQPKTAKGGGLVQLIDITTSLIYYYIQNAFIRSFDHYNMGGYYREPVCVDEKHMQKVLLDVSCCAR